MVTKKKTRFFKSLRFRIMVILVILGIVPGIIVTQLMIGNYKQQAIGGTDRRDTDAVRNTLQPDH